MQEALIERNHCLNWKDIKSGFGGSWEDLRTNEIRTPLIIAIAGSQRFNYGHQLQDSGLVPEFSHATQIYEKAKRIGIIKVKDELLTYPEIKSMMIADKKESLPHTA